MLEPRVELRGPVVMPGQREHPRVLPGAIRVHRREPHAARRVILGHALRQRRMGPAQQVPLAAADLRQQLAHQRHLARLARVRGAAQRQLGRRDLEALDDTVRHERYSLERLRRRAPEGDEVGIASPGNEFPFGIDHGDVDRVPGLHNAAADLINVHHWRGELNGKLARVG